MDNHQAILLKDLVSALRSKKLNRDNFDMGVWIENTIPKKPTLECGSAACAAGLAIATLPSWKKAGFKLKKGIYLSYRPVFGKYTEFCALADGLGITYIEAVRVFDPAGYSHHLKISPEAVASRIRRLLKKYGY